MVASATGRDNFMRSSVSTLLSAVLLLAAGVSLRAGQSALPRISCPALGPGEVAARVVSLSGQVYVLHDSQPFALNVGDAVQAKQVIVSEGDGNAVFCVSDGSSFEVFPNSEVVFRDNPGSWRDLLDVLVGRIRVEIEKLGGPNPNRVVTPTATISVRGTIFDVTVDDEERTTEVAVEEGSVAVRHRLFPSGNDKIVSEGETLKVYPDQPLSQSRIDKGALAERVLRALADAARVAITTPRTGGTTTGTGSPGGGINCGSACSGDGSGPGSTKGGGPPGAPPGN